MSKKTKVIGFGYAPEESKAHFEVWIPRSRSESVRVYECMTLLDDQAIDPAFNQTCVSRLDVARDKWNHIAPVVRQVFNATLTASNLRVGEFRTDKAVYFSRLLGKELMVLLWAIEEASTPEEMANAIANWSSCDRTTRWWLYALTSTAHGGKEAKGRGWRRALYYALASHQDAASVTALA